MADEWGEFEAVQSEDPWSSFETVGDDDEWAGFEQQSAAQEQLAEEEEGITAGDFGRSVMAGGAQVGAGAGWATRKLGELTNSQMLADAGTALEERGNESARMWQEGMSDAAKSAEQETFLKENEDSWTGYEMGDAGFGKVGLMLGNSLLGTAAGMGAGAAATAGLKMLPGVSRGVAATLGYSSGEALVAAPSSGAAAEEEVAAMTEEELAGHVEYEALRLTGDSFEEAKKKLKDAAGGDAAMYTAISTALLSSPFGRVLDKVMGGEGGSMMGGLVKGGITEGAQETLQSGAEQGSVNLAMLTNADADRSLMQDVPEAMVGGLAAGSAMGAGMGAGQGYAQGRATADEKAQIAAEAAKAAGGDDLDAELARQKVFDEAEGQAALGTDMPTDPYMPAEWTEETQPAVPDNPYAQQFNQMPLSAEDEMAAGEAELEQALGERASREGQNISDKIQIGPVMAEDGFAQDEFLPYEDDRRRQALADQLVADEKAEDLELEQRSYDANPPIRPIPATPSDEELGPPAVPARQEIEEQTVAELNKAIKEATKALPEPIKGNQKVATPEMELAQAIATLGGLNREEAGLQGVDSADFDKRSGGIARVFTKNGKTFDEMAEALDELGFFDDSAEGYNPNTLLEKVTKSLSGEAQYSAQSETAGARIAGQQEIDKIEQTLADFQNNYDEDQSTPPLGPSYQGLDDEERKLSYTVMEAELAGVDPMTVDMIMDEDISLAEIETKIRRNIDNVRGKKQEDKGGDEGYTETSQSAQPEAESGGSENGQEVNKPGNAADIAANEADADGQNTMFGATPVAEQSLADALKAKEEARNGTQDVESDIDDGLFSGNQNQVDIADQIAGTEVSTEVDQADQVPAVQTTNYPATEQDTRDFNNNKVMIKSAVELFVGNDPGRVARIRGAIERGATDGAIIKAAGINAFNKSKVKQDETYPGDVKSTSKGLQLTDYRGGEKTKVLLTGKDLASRLRELYAPPAAEFGMDIVDQSQDTDLIDLELSPEQSAIAERVQKNVADMSKQKLAVVLDQIGINPGGLTTEGISQRVAIMRIVMDDMQQHDSLQTWRENIKTTAQQKVIEAAANILDKRGAKTRSFATYEPSTGILHARLGKILKMPERTPAQQAVFDKRQKEAKDGSKDFDIKEYLTPTPDIQGEIAPTGIEQKGGQAKAGGEYGLNGEWYAGGQFMPASATTVKGAWKPEISGQGGTGRQLIGPGEFAKPPEGYNAIFSGIRNFAEVNDGVMSRNGVDDATLENFQGVAQVEADIAAWNDGKRFRNEDGYYNHDTAAASAAAAKLEETILTEEFEDENGDIIVVEQSALNKVRQIEKKLTVMDRLLECLL